MALLFNTLTRNRLMKKGIKVFGFIVTLAISFVVNAQDMPTGFKSFEERIRRLQLLGDTLIRPSFNIRPFSSKVYLADSATKLYAFSGIVFSGKKSKARIELLPFELTTQLNTTNPYGWNDGLMIPSRGFQSYISGGFYLKAGPFQVQLRPEAVWSANQAYQGFTNPYVLPFYYRYTYNYIDSPERFGDDAYYRLHPGQSFAGLNLGPVFIGASSQNIWWGPGKRNALIFSNNAPGFYHLGLKTTKPIETLIGTFEFQTLVGKLEGSGYLPTQIINPLYLNPIDDWRYLSGFTVNYSPSWFSGFHFGASRVFQQYFGDTKKNKDYFPGVLNIFKANDPVSDDLFNRDQMISVYFRWVWKKVQAELYAEYGRNDASWNLRDFIMTPEHSRAYILGFSKLFALSGKDRYLQLNAELTQLQQSSNYINRDAKSWYLHSQVTNGFTHLGQVIGAGIGPGSNLQSLEASWVSGLNKIGMRMERLTHNNDFYNVAFSYNPLHSPWVDTSAALLFDRNFNRFFISANLSFVNSNNYQWGFRPGEENAVLPRGERKLNTFGNVKAVYRFGR